MGRVLFILIISNMAYANSWINDGSREIDVQCQRYCEISIRENTELVNTLVLTRPEIVKRIKQRKSPESPMGKLAHEIALTCQDKALCKLNFWMSFFSSGYPISRVKIFLEQFEFVSSEYRVNKALNSLKDYLNGKKRLQVHSASQRSMESLLNMFN